MRLFNIPLDWFLVWPCTLASYLLLLAEGLVLCDGWSMIKERQFCCWLEDGCMVELCEMLEY